jgi:hypothetical protein
MPMTCVLDSSNDMAAIISEVLEIPGPPPGQRSPPPLLSREPAKQPNR